MTAQEAGPLQDNPALSAWSPLPAIQAGSTSPSSLLPSGLHTILPDQNSTPISSRSFPSYGVLRLRVGRGEAGEAGVICQVLSITLFLVSSEEKRVPLNHNRDEKGGPASKEMNTP
jgi:hypothetical protein